VGQQLRCAGAEVAPEQGGSVAQPVPGENCSCELLNSPCSGATSASGAPPLLPHALQPGGQCHVALIDVVGQTAGVPFVGVLMAEDETPAGTKPGDCPAAVARDDQFLTPVGKVATGRVGVGVEVDRRFWRLLVDEHACPW